VTHQDKRRFGMAGPFPILFTEAWKEDSHVFAAEGGSTESPMDTHCLGPPEWVTVSRGFIQPMRPATGPRHIWSVGNPSLNCLEVRNEGCPYGHMLVRAIVTLGATLSFASKGKTKTLATG
jgi:hypothetical protein